MWYDCVCCILYFWFDGSNRCIQLSPNFELFSERTVSITRKLKFYDTANFLSFLFLYEVSLIRIKEQVGKKRDTVVSHRNADSFVIKHVLKT